MNFSMSITVYHYSSLEIGHWEMGHHNELTLCSTIIILSINIPMSIMIQKSPQNFKVVIKLGGRHFSPYYPVQFTILLHRWFTIPVSKLGTVQLVL